MQAPDYPAMLEEALEAGRGRDYARSVEILTRVVGGTDTPSPGASLPGPQLPRTR